MRLHLRPINKADQNLLFAWRNDPFIVERSTSKKNVNIEDHKIWFEHTLADKNTLAFIIEIKDKPIGHVRFNEDDQCVITIYIIEQWIGKGYGVKAIKEGCDLAHNHWNNDSILAYVRVDNLAGHSGFLKDGFVLTEGPCPDNHLMLIFSYKREESSTANRFSQLFIEHGVSHKSLNWGSREGQQLRFKILAEIGDLEGNVF